MPTIVPDVPNALAFTPEQARRLKPLEGKQPGTLQIHEIYRSVQGESLYAGLPCLFIRLTACHLRCGYCDTPHAFHQGVPRSLDEVLELVEASADALVEITGGEPLLQPEVYPLMTQIADLGKTVLLETSGSLSIAQVDPRVHIILDIKTPGSGEVAANDIDNYARLKPDDEIKFVLCDRADFDWSIKQVQTHRLLDRCSVLFSPAFSQVSPQELGEWILASGLGIRLQLQLHKQLWHPNARGV